MSTMEEGHAQIDAVRYEQSLQKLLQSAPIPEDPYPFPRVANVVTTWRMLPESGERRQNRKFRRRRRSRSLKKGQIMDEHTLDLHSFARQNPTAKLNTSNFSAVVCRGCDGTTSLLFSSGSGVAVHAKSPALGIYACRMYSHLIERTPMLMMDEDVDVKGWKAGSGYLPGVPKMRTLEGRISFENAYVENIVAFGYLGCRISLERIYASHPDRVRYDPGNFPGLEWQSTVIDPTTQVQKTIKNLIFESGMWLIIGAQDMSIANEVYWRLRKVAHEFRATNTHVLQENERHEARLHRLWNQMYEPLILAGDQEEIAAILPSAAPKSLEQMMDVAGDKIRRERETRLEEQERKRKRRLRKERRPVTVEEADEERARKRKMIQEQSQREDDERWSTLMIAASRGNLVNVRMLLEMGEDPAYVNATGATVMDIIKDEDGEQFDQIRQLLLRHLVPVEHYEEAGLSISYSDDDEEDGSY